MLRIHSKVMTEYGEGILVSVTTPHNGLYVSYEQADCVVWFGSENPGTHRYSEDGRVIGKWISREIPLKDLIEMNQDRIRNEKIEDILNA